MKKLCSIILSVVITVSCVIGSYSTAYATGAEVVGGAVFGLTSIIISGLGFGGLAPDSDYAIKEVLAELVDDMGSGVWDFVSTVFNIPDLDSELETALAERDEVLAACRLKLSEIAECRRNGEELTSDEEYVYSEYATKVTEIYYSVVKDMLDSGTFDDSDDFAALQGLFSVITPDVYLDGKTVSNSEVREVLQRYVDTRRNINGALNGLGDRLFSVVGDVVAVTRELYSDLVQTVNKAVKAYSSKQSNTITVGSCPDEPKYSYYTTYTFGWELLGQCVLEGDLLRFLLEYQTEEGTAYAVFRDSDDTYWLATLYWGDNYVYPMTLCKNSDNSGYFHLSCATSMRVTHYDTDGSYMYQYDSCRRNTLYGCTLLYYHCLDVEENALSIMGLPALPYSFPYGSVGTIGRDTSIPIDNVYADEEEHVVPIDDYELPDIIYSNADTFDKTIDVIGNAGISIDVSDTDDKAKVWNDSYVNDKAEADAKSEADVKPDVKDNVEADIGTPSFSIDDYTVSGLGGKFPFCIPFDLINMIKLLVVNRQAPRFVFPFTWEEIGLREEIVLDLSLFEDVAKVVRSCEVIGFIWFLTTKTRGLIKG